MKLQQIVVLAVLALADICVLAAGVAILLNGAKASSVTPVAVQAAGSPGASPTLAASETPTPSPPAPKPTETHWPTWTPRPSETSISTITPIPTATSTDTPPPPPTPKSASATGNATRPAKSAPPAPTEPTGCEPNTRPTNGKLDVLWSLVAARTDPANSSRAIVTVQILPSGGGGGYKYQILGRNYTSGCIEVTVPMCSSTPSDIIVTAANGSRWKDTVMIEAGSNLGFRCK